MKKILALIVIGVIGYFSYEHYMNNNVVSTDKLTFTEMVNLSKKAVLSEVPGSDFYIATTLPGVRIIEAIYRGNDSCPSVAVTVTDKGETKVEKQSSPWLECVVIKLPLKMTLEEAESKLDNSKFAGKWSEVVVRSPLGPVSYPALYIFTVDGVGWVAVNTLTGEVFQIT
tara:strand:+ start:180 stop:689 length:510 start_codon:yes stop_codon:yes gene_type:complete